MARDFSKNTSNYMSLGVNKLSRLLAGAQKVSFHVWAYPDTLDASATTNSLFSALISTGVAGIRANVNASGTPVLRVNARAASAESTRIVDGLLTVNTGAWNSLGACIDFASDEIRPFVGGIADTPGAAAFTAPSYTPGTPADADPIGANIIPPSTTTQQWDGRITEVAIWRDDIGAGGFAQLAAGKSAQFIHPETLVFYMPLYQLDDAAGPVTDLVAGITGTITGTIATAAGPATARPFAGPARARCYVHEGYWPYYRIAELTTAHDMNRSFELMAPGQATIAIADTDPAFTDDIVKRGNILVITSPVAPTWAGPITVITDDLDGGDTKIEALEMAAVLTVRATRLGEIWSEGASGAVFASILNGVNTRGHTGLFLDPLYEPGPAIAALSLGGQDALSALMDLNARTNYEWWVDYDATPARLVATMHWGARQGLDRSADVQLLEGRDFVRREYTLDVSKLRQSVTIVGGRGAIADRTAVTIAAGTAPGSASIGGAVEAASQQLAEALDVPPMLRSETIMLRPNTSDRASLSREALSALERPAGAAEKFAVSVNVNTDWRNLNVGDYVEISTSAAVRRARIIGMQPDEEVGDCDLVMEVPVR